MLDSKQIREQLRDMLDSFSEISQDSDTDIFECTDRDAEIRGPHLGDSGDNSDGQTSENVGRGDDEDNDNADWTLWGENGHDCC
jgi:hypothetical protein